MSAAINPVYLIFGIFLGVILMLLLWWMLMASIRAYRSRNQIGASQDIPPRVAVIAHGQKMTSTDSRVIQLNEKLGQRNWPPAQWLMTTADDHGAGQARQARYLAFDQVWVMGGDGTVRACAGELLWSGIALGILPGGTGNLLARNLDIPHNDFASALDIVLGDGVRTIDAVRCTIGNPHDSSDKATTFLVMAGMGFDAQVMASVRPELKQRIGWLAYVVAGFRHLAGRRIRLTIQCDDQPAVSFRARSVVVGNCGQLTGGIRLLPQAEVDDGLIDVVVVTPRGVLQWVPVLAHVLTRRKNASEESLHSELVHHFRCTKVHIASERPMPVQLDGDALGETTSFTAEVAPASLLIKSAVGASK